MCPMSCSNPLIFSDMNYCKAHSQTETLLSTLIIYSSNCCHNNVMKYHFAYEETEASTN